MTRQFDLTRILPSILGSLAVSATFVASLEAVAQSDQPPEEATYWHNWTDGDGLSHLALCNLQDFKLESMTPAADPLWLNSQKSADARVLTIVKPVGWKGNWHSGTSPIGSPMSASDPKRTLAEREHGFRST